jgi:hypothetical protein
MMNRGKKCKNNGEKIRLNLENLKFFKLNQEVSTYHWCEIIKVKIFFRNSKLQTSQVYWNKKVMIKIKINNSSMDLASIKEIELTHTFFFISKITFLLSLILIQKMNLEINKIKKRITIGRKKSSCWLMIKKDGCRRQKTWGKRFLFFYRKMRF